jgi:photosystem II stability/assembly factor-like uncharacterized protein
MLISRKGLSFILLFISSSLFSVACKFSSTARSISTKNSNTEPTIEQKKTEQKQELPNNFGLDEAELLNRSTWILSDYNNRLWKTGDGGTTWKLLNSPKNNNNDDQSIRGMSFVNEQIGFLLVGNQVFRSDDVGETWKVLGKFEDENFKANNMFFLNEKRGWVVGSLFDENAFRANKESIYKGIIYSTLDGGVTWKLQQLTLRNGFPLNVYNWHLSDVVFKDENNGWAAGKGAIFWTNDGGDTWNQARAREDIFEAVYFIDNMNGWVTLKENSRFYVTKDGGKSWAFLDSLRRYGGRKPRFVFDTKQHGFAAYNGLFETNDGGASWIKVKTDYPNEERLYDWIGRAKDGTLVVLSIADDTIVLTSSDGIKWGSIRDRESQ